MPFPRDASSLPLKYFPQDFPPVPKCFVHLLSSNEASGEESNVSSFLKTADDDETCDNEKSVIRAEDFQSVSTIRSSSDCKPGSSDSTLLVSFDKSATSENSSQLPSNQGNRKDNKQNQAKRPAKSKDSESNEEKKYRLGKLNSSLSKLKQEMTDLRSLDVSLFFQLLSLNEAIQDFKSTVGDRYSETGSEYSLGSASYMGSMSSLSEEDCDWFDAQQKSLDDSQVFENNQSASSLLDQITALVKNADADF